MTAAQSAKKLLSNLGRGRARLGHGRARVYPCHKNASLQGGFSPWGQPFSHRGFWGA